jgi:prepilin-type processing-associated H-X9-DG protein
LPAVQAAREAARRAQCTNNLKQLALAANNYVSANNIYPAAAYSVQDPAKSGNYQRDNFSSFVRLLPFSEQAPMYNCVNFNLTYANVENYTVAGVKMGFLNCPSDVADPQYISTGTANAGGWGNYDVVPTTNIYLQQFTSYSGCQGTFHTNWYTGKSATTTSRDQQNGVITIEQPVGPAQVIDGTSNTFMYGEKAHMLFARFDTTYQNCDTAWQSGLYFDTMLTTLYPPNVGTSSTPIKSFTYYYPITAASMHPGGVNYAFCDGSVRFIKNSIDSWSFSQGNADKYGDSMPDYVSYDATNIIYTVLAGCRFGVYQALSTRNGGEVVSSDQY